MLLHLCELSLRKGYNVGFLCLKIKLRVNFDFNLFLNFYWAAVKPVMFVFLCYCFLNSEYVKPLDSCNVLICETNSKCVLFVHMCNLPLCKQ